MLAFLVRLVQVLGILMLVRLVLRALAAPRPAAAPQRPATSRDLVRDRVCNTFLRRDRALRVVVAGREEFFCSEGCRDRGLREGSAALPPP